MVFFPLCQRMIPLLLPSALQRILQESRTIAVVGLSLKPERPSYQVARYLQEVGYQIIPVNPGQSEILGERCYPDLRSVPVAVDVVDIFRRAEEVEPIVCEAIAIRAKVIWMQQGIVNEAAARLAEQAGLTVVMDRCLKVELEWMRGALSRCPVLPSSV
ncbi:CoA-binding protein [Candidatus Electronema sp. PJ]|uniref:CoA-binding protein n=1 Tax=Candidatus Electronema sp. PJ TaxID=3401572 RepID=UPI003AA88C7E